MTGACGDRASTGRRNELPGRPIRSPNTTQLEDCNTVRHGNVERLFDSELRDFEGRITLGDDLLRNARNLISKDEAKGKVGGLEIIVGARDVGKFQAPDFDS